MNREDIYAKLRQLDCSVNSADCIAYALSIMSESRVKAFLAWLQGDDPGVSERTMRRIRQEIRKIDRIK